MKTLSARALAVLLLSTAGPSYAGQSPYAASAADVPVSSRPRLRSRAVFQYRDRRRSRQQQAGRLHPTGRSSTWNLSPLYRGQVLVHGMGFSPDHHTLAVVAIGSNAVIFIATSTNTVKHVTYVGRSPHEAFFTPDGSEVWVTIRGENYVSVIDSATYYRESPDHRPERPGNADILAGWTVRIHLFFVYTGDGDCVSAGIERSLAMYARRVHFVQISRRRLMESKSGLRSRTPAKSKSLTRGRRSR